MIKGTTPTHTFSIPVEADMVKEAMIIYAQDDNEVFRKETAECEMNGKTISVTLSQEETLMFNHARNVQIQIRLLTIEGAALASHIIVVSVGKVLCEEVIY